MSERPPFPVEPLSERRWQDIRKNVLAQAALVTPRTAAPDVPRAARARVATVGFAAVAAAVTLAWLGSGTPPPATALSRIVTDGSSATASAGDATVSLAAHTSVLIIERDTDTWVVSLENGSAHFDVPPRGERPVFTVEAGRTRVQVIGTGFTVTREPGAPSASVSVDHGAVRVTDGAVDIVLHDGERWPELAPSASAETTSASVVAEASGVAPSPQLADEHPTPRTPRAVLRPAPSAPPAVATAISATPEPSTTADAVTQAAVPPVVAPTSPTPSERFREAASLERSDPEAALAIYVNLAAGPSAWSAPALFAEARLEAELGHHDRARALAQQYLAAHPDGLNAEDARELLRRIH